MNICKILDLTPGTAMSSWGTIHFPDERRLIEFVINVESTEWRSTSWSPCKPAPDGGFLAIQEGQARLMKDIADIDSRFKAQMICREDVTEGEAVRLLLGELEKVNYPSSLEEEAAKIRKILGICSIPSLEKTPQPKPKRRFEVE